MDVRASHLIAKLAEHGWHIVSREWDDLQW